MTENLERRLREVLHREAEQIHPRERRTEILAMAHNKARSGEPARRWLIPAAAAASVALIGTVIWGVSSSGSEAPPALAHPITSTAGPASTPTSDPSPATVAVPNPSPTGSADATGAGTSTQVALPAYFVGASSTAGDQFGLYREFVGSADLELLGLVTPGATKDERAKAAVAVAMNVGQPFTDHKPYLQPWLGTSLTGVTVTPSLITITIGNGGSSGFTAAQTRLAVQELVWTAQAAVGQGTTPVKFVLADGSARLFGTYPTAQTYNRPAPGLQYEVLAPIWITSPLQNQVFPTGTTVLATGQSCAFEGTTKWQLKNGGTVVRSGVTTATSGCPTRGTWQVRLGALPAGSYTFRMFEVSMKDGKVIAETSEPFTVR